MCVQIRGYSCSEVRCECSDKRLSYEYKDVQGVRVEWT